MGYVKKTITESIGETSVTTSIEFETYEDFMTYEKSLAASRVEFCKNDLQSVDIEKMMVDEQGPKWIDHDGKGLPDFPDNSVIDFEYRSGLTWRRQSEPEEFVDGIGRRKRLEKTVKL